MAESPPGLPGVPPLEPMDQIDVMDFFPTSPTALLIYLNYCLMALIGSYIALALLKRPRQFLAGAVLWGAWFTWALLHGSMSVEELSQRWAVTFEATQRVFPVVVDLLVAWCQLLLPFFSDSVSLGLLVWNQLDWTKRGILALTIVLGYGFAVTVQKIRKHKEDVKAQSREVLKMASVFVVAPCAWVLLGWVPYAWYPYVTSLVISVSPAVVSGWAYQQAGLGGKRVTPRQNNQLRSWLTYWSCWPIIQILHSRVVPADSQDVQRLFLIAVLWLQYYKGSKLLWHILRTAYRLVRSILPYGSALSSMGSERQLFMTLWKWKSKLGPILKNKLTVGLAIGGCTILLIRVFYFMTDALTLCLFLGAAVDAERVVQEQMTPIYKQKLAFWILAQLLDVMLAVPLVGRLLGLLQPLLLGLFLVAGELVLGMLLSIVLWSRAPVSGDPPPYTPKEEKSE